MEEIFDRQALLRRVDGDEELLEEMLVIFLEFTPRQLQEIGQAIETGDTERAAWPGPLHQRRCSQHQRQGGAAGRKMEQAGKDHDLDQPAQAFEALTQEFSRFQEIFANNTKNSAPMAVTSESTAAGLARTCS